MVFVAIQQLLRRTLQLQQIDVFDVRCPEDGSESEIRRPAMGAIRRVRQLDAEPQLGEEERILLEETLHLPLAYLHVDKPLGRSRRLRQWPPDRV
jgi:hypothetical protein